MTVQNLEDLVSSLLECSSSNVGQSELVCDQVADSLKVIALNQPNTFLSACHQYLIQNPKLPPSAKAFVLNAIEIVVSDGSIVSCLDEQLALLVINLATQEMTMTSKSSDSAWADAAQNTLVAFAKSERFVAHVLDAVLQKFPPGVPTSPHRHIVLTLSAIAIHNPFGLIPFLTDILSRTVPVIPHVRTDPLRSAWARAICSFCESIRECQTERPKEAVDYDHSLYENGSPRHEQMAELQNVADRAMYSDQAEVIYDVVFQWLYSKDAKARADAAECVGELCLVIRPLKVVEDLKKLVYTIIGLYKKSTNEHHIITMAMCRFLEATCADETCPLDGYVDDILNALFPNACLDPDDTTTTLNPNAIKNHSEAFRCFHVAAARFADKIVYYLLHKMQNVADMHKLGAINVLRHLLNSAGPHMEDKRSLVMMGLRKLLAAEHTTSTRVKRAIVQLCVALADHAYVDAEGGDHVIAFLVRNLVPPSELDLQTPMGIRLTDYSVHRIDGETALHYLGRKPDPDIAGSNQLRTQCAQALNTIASTCVCAGKLLWPYLFEFVCVERYTPVVGDIFKCLRTLVTREREAERELDFVTGFDNPKVAGRHAVFTRLFVCMCNAPLNGLLARRAREALVLLLGIGEWFHPSMREVIANYYLRMEPLLDELCNATVSSPSADSPATELRGKRLSRWHEAVLELLSACIAVVVDGDWRMEVVSSFAKQLDLYKELPDEKALLLRCMGVSLSKIATLTFVVDHLMLMFKSTNHSNPTERQGCARGVAAVAVAHTNTVLVELENVSKWEHAKKSSGFFGFIKDAMPLRQYTDLDMVNLRATLMLTYGHVVMACPIDTVAQRLNSTIVVFLRHYFANTKQEPVVREAMLETMRLIAITVMPNRISPDYKFEPRNELLSYIKDYVQSETPEMLSSSVRLLAAKAVAALLRLEPPLSELDMKDLAQVITQSILPMCREKSGLKTFAYDLFDYASTSLSAFTSDGTTYRKIEDDESATLMEATVTAYGSALEAMVRSKPTTNTLTILLKMLQPYYGHSADHERSRAIDATVLVLRVYYEFAEDITIGHASDFLPLSSLLARLGPRLADSLSQVRHQALLGIHWALRLSFIHKGHDRETGSSLFNLEHFAHEHLQEEGRLDGQAAKRTIKALAEVIESNLPQSHMQMYLSGLFEMLTDRQSQVSSSAAQLLTYILTSRGSTLVNEADTLVSTLLNRLGEVSTCQQTYADALAAMVAFAGHQTHAVCDVLLRQPLPFSVFVCDSFGCISKDRSLFPSILDYLQELLTTSLDNPFDVVDTGAGNSVKVIHAEPCQYAAAITEVVKNGEPEWNLNERVPALLATLFHFICSASDTQFPVVQKENKDGTKQPLIITPDLRRAMDKPPGMAVTSILAILTRLRSVSIVEEMNQARGWTECLDRELFISALSQLIRSIAEHRPDWIGELWSAVAARAEAESEPLRLAAVIVASALIKRSPDAHGQYCERLLVDCVRLLQNELTDSSLRVRKLCVRGLGDLASCSSPTATERFANMAVEAAMAGLDDRGDRRDVVAMESILALSKLVSRTDDEQLIRILPNVLLKIRPCFEKESPQLRSASFSLFGELGARVGENSEEFRSHLHANIIATLLHLNDDDEDVRKKCSLALFLLHTLLNVGALSNIVEEQLPQGKCPTSYQAFIQDFAGVLALSFTDRVNHYALTCSNYYKSSSARIRCSAALLTGHLLGVLTPQLRGTISKDLIFTGLVLLLKDTEEITVRVSAAKAIANLHHFS